MNLGTLDGGGWSTPRPGRLYPGKDAGTRCTEDWVGLGAGLYSCGKSRPHRDSIPGPSNPQRVAIPTEPSRLHLSTVRHLFKQQPRVHRRQTVQMFTGVFLRSILILRAKVLRRQLISCVICYRLLLMISNLHKLVMLIVCYILWIIVISRA